MVRPQINNLLVVVFSSSAVWSFWFAAICFVFPPQVGSKE